MNWRGSIKIFALAVCLHASLAGICQLDSTLHSAVLENTFSIYDYQEPTKRAFLKTKDLSFAQKLNPLVYISGGLMFVYQRVISEQLTGNCAYELTCSSFAKRMIEKHGLAKGIYFGAYRLMSCNESCTEDTVIHMIDPETGRVRSKYD
jgi:putative component of membrane protein insertase Oxa1/YidC/SpoIIIJ protein YidD